MELESCVCLCVRVFICVALETHIYMLDICAYSCMFIHASILK